MKSLCIDDELIAVEGDVLGDEVLNARSNLPAVIIGESDRTDIHRRESCGVAFINDGAVLVANDLRAVVRDAIDFGSGGIAPQIADRDGIARLQAVSTGREPISRTVGECISAAVDREVAARRETAIVDVDRAGDVGKHRALGQEIMLGIARRERLTLIDGGNLDVVDEQIDRDARIGRAAVADGVRIDGGENGGIVRGEEQ